MHKAGTIAFLLFGIAVIGGVTFFASNTRNQFDDLQEWVTTEGLTFERPGERRSYRITGEDWNVEAIQGDKLAPPSLAAKPMTLWRAPEAASSHAFILTPHLPSGVYTNIEHRSQNQERVFHYILGEEARHFSSLSQTELPPALRDTFTLFSEGANPLSPFDQAAFVAELLALRERLGHSPILVAGPEGLSIRAQTMVFGPETLRQVIHLGQSLRPLVKPSASAPTATQPPGHPQPGKKS
jgi:hypothetical protein